MVRSTVRTLKARFFPRAFTFGMCGLLLHSACLLALGTGKPLREFGQQAWESDSGLPQNTVHAIAQTRDGFLWIGTEAGLVRFDGVDFAVFDTKNTPALRSDFISSLQQDSNGGLWVGTAEGLVREQAGAFTAYGTGVTSPVVLALYLTLTGRLLALTPEGAAAWAGRRFLQIAGTEHLGLTEGASMVTEDAEGRVWITGLEGAALIGPNANAALPALLTRQVGEMQACAAAATGELWIGGSNGLAVLAQDGKSRLPAPGGLPSTNITKLLPAAGQGMWIGTSKGLALFSHGAVKQVPELAGLRVSGLFLDRAGTLWVATSDGLARITDGRVDLAPHPLAGVLTIFEDREGSMWFGTETAGLHVLRDQAFSTLTKDDGLSAGLVRAIFQDHAGTMWIGTSGGGLDRVDAGRVSHFTGSLPSKVILALAETDAGAQRDLWVGTPEGLARVHGSETKTFTTADGLTDDFVRSLYADRDGSLWIGTRNGLSHYSKGVFHSYSKLDGLPSDLIGTILRGGDGELWVGTLGGLSRMSGESFLPVAVRNGQPEGAITALLEDHAGTLWVGVNNFGLSRLRRNVATAFHSAKLPATIYGMLEDARGDLWLSSRQGVDRVSLRALDAFSENGAGSLAVTHYGSADGMRISEASGGGHPAAWRAQDGALWFATLDGAAVVHPEATQPDSVPPLAAIEQISIDDQPAARTGEPSVIRVAPGHGRLSIKYAGLSFVAPQKLRYRYILEGFDKSWVEAEGRRTAFYTNLPPGGYRFLVRCVNGEGVWSVAAASQRFRIEPFFYQTGWFYALAALGLATLGYLIYHWRVLTVEAQYRAVSEERARIAREIHDTLAQGYVAIAVQLELAEHLVASSADAAIQQLRQTKEMVREGLAEARSSIWNLRTQSEAEALPSLLAAHVALVARRYAAETSIKFSVHGSYRPLARIVEKEVERIAQQAIANAVAHAQASLITTTLSYAAERLELRVTDNGVGMLPESLSQPLRGHFGLQGMRERADRIGALLEVDSAPALGVRVTLRLDLQHAAKENAR